MSKDNRNNNWAPRDLFDFTRQLPDSGSNNTFDSVMGRNWPAFDERYGSSNYISEIMRRAANEDPEIRRKREEENRARTAELEETQRRFSNHIFGNMRKRANGEPIDEEANRREINEMFGLDESDPLIEEQRLREDNLREERRQRHSDFLFNRIRRQIDGVPFDPEADQREMEEILSDDEEDLLQEQREERQRMFGPSCSSRSEPIIKQESPKEENTLEQKIALYKSQQDDTPGSECSVCMEDKAGKILIAPCGHTNVCLDCISILSDCKCPTCRGDIKDLFRVYN